MSRRLEDLHPVVQAKARAWLADCARAGLDLLITCTYRSPEEQDRLYAQGRTAPGRRVTNARAGESIHQYGLALDFVPLRDGKPVWDDSAPEWAQAGALAEQHGFEWAGRWTSFREFPHIQYTGGLTLAEVRNGAHLRGLA